MATTPLKGHPAQCPSNPTSQALRRQEAALSKQRPGSRKKGPVCELQETQPVLRGLESQGPAEPSSREQEVNYTTFG